MKKNKFLLPVMLLICCINQAAQCQTPAVAPPGDVLRPGHLGRQTGDLERIIHFYHDLLGLGLRGKRDEPRPFWSSPGLIEFANTPSSADFRAVIMPIPGTTAAPDAGNEMTIEAIEFRNMERHQYVHNLSDIGSSHLVLILHNLDQVLDRLKAEGVPVVTSGGAAVNVPASSGPYPEQMAVIVRDPDGYPVELTQPLHLPASTAPDASNIAGARISVTVADLEATEKLYRRLVGPELQFQTSPSFTVNEAYNKLGNTAGAEYRYGVALIPGSPVALEFIQYRNIDQRTIKPILQDIGVAHVLFMVKDMNTIMPRLRAAGLHPLAASGEPVFIAPSVSALFVTDPNNFFIEFMAHLPDEKVRSEE